MSVAIPSLFGTSFVSAVPAVPSPFAEYDFNYYSASSTLLNDLKGGAPATIILPTNNTFYSGTNSYLNIFTSPIGTTGCIQLAYIPNIQAIELWVSLSSLSANDQYLLDTRTGAEGYWITNSTDTIGPAFSNSKISANTLSYIVNQSAGTPSLRGLIFSRGWVHLVLNLSTTINDDVTLFARYTQQQALPVNVAYIALHTSNLSDSSIKALYNKRCARFGLASAP